MFKNSLNRKVILSAMVLFILIIAAGCTAPTPTATPTEVPPAPTEVPTAMLCVPQILDVSAAASLTEAFTEIGTSFQLTNPCVQPVFNFAGSQALSKQITEGAPVDVFASASKKNMEEVNKEGLLADSGSQVFAQNGLAVVVCPTTSFKVDSIKDLAQPGLKLVVAAKEVPVGDYTNQFLEKATADPDLGQSYVNAVKANEVTFEADVKSVLTKVDLCEGDAGIVYQSDGFSDPTQGIKMIVIPDALNIIAKYPIAAIKTSDTPDLAQKFIDFVLSPEGQAILMKYGLKSAE